MKSISELKELVKEHEADIIVGVGVLFISLVSFAAGYLAAREHLKEPVSVFQQDIHGREE